MQLCLLGSHVAAVTVEGADCSLSTAMEGSSRRSLRGSTADNSIGWLCNSDSGLLSGSQLLNDTVSGASTRLGALPLIVGGHLLDNKGVFAVSVVTSVHVDRLKLLLEATILHVGHEGGLSHVTLSSLDRISCRLTNILAHASSRSTLGLIGILVSRV